MDDYFGGGVARGKEGRGGEEKKGDDFGFFTSLKGRGFISAETRELRDKAN